MSGSNYPTFETLLLLLNYLSDHLLTIIRKTKVSWIKEIAKEMNEKFNSVLDNLYNSSAYLALVLDPRYKLQILPDGIDAEIIKQTLISKFNNYQILEQLPNNESNDKKTGDKRKSIGILEHIVQKKKKLIVHIMKLINI
jgi:hypothetical protein